MSLQRECQLSRELEEAMMVRDYGITASCLTFWIVDTDTAHYRVDVERNVTHENVFRDHRPLIGMKSATNQSRVSVTPKRGPMTAHFLAIAAECRLMTFSLLS
jgi:hypothetical protein